MHKIGAFFDVFSRSMQIHPNINLFATILLYTPNDRVYKQPTYGSDMINYICTVGTSEYYAIPKNAVLVWEILIN